MGTHSPLEGIYPANAFPENVWSARWVGEGVGFGLRGTGVVNTAPPTSVLALAVATVVSICTFHLNCSR